METLAKVESRTVYTHIYAKKRICNNFLESDIPLLGKKSNLLVGELLDSPIRF